MPIVNIIYNWQLSKGVSYQYLVNIDNPTQLPSGGVYIFNEHLDSVNIPILLPSREFKFSVYYLKEDYNFDSYIF